MLSRKKNPLILKAKSFSLKGKIFEHFSFGADNDAKIKPDLDTRYEESFGTRQCSNSNILDLVANLFIGTVGAGVLLLPATFKFVGSVRGIIAIVAIGLLTLFTSWLYLVVADRIELKIFYEKFAAEEKKVEGAKESTKSALADYRNKSLIRIVEELSKTKSSIFFSKVFPIIFFLVRFTLMVFLNIAYFVAILKYSKSVTSSEVAKYLLNGAIFFVTYVYGWFLLDCGPRTETDGQKKLRKTKWFFKSRFGWKDMLDIIMGKGSTLLLILLLLTFVGICIKSFHGVRWSVSTSEVSISEAIPDSQYLLIVGGIILPTISMSFHNHAAILYLLFSKFNNGHYLLDGPQGTSSDYKELPDAANGDGGASMPLHGEASLDKIKVLEQSYSSPRFKAIIINQLIVAVLYLFVCFWGYNAFQEAIASNLLDNLVGYKGLADVARAIFIFAITVKCAIYSKELSDQSIKLMQVLTCRNTQPQNAAPQSQANAKASMVLPAIMFFVCAIASLLITLWLMNGKDGGNFEKMFRLASACCGSFVMFIFPVILFCNVFWNDIFAKPMRGLFLFFMMVLSVATGLGSLGLGIYTFIKR